jgi:hypothetical protein
LNIADTLNVLREIPLRTNDLAKDRLSGKARGEGEERIEYEHVAAASRISHFDLRLDAIPSLHLNLVLQDKAKTGLLAKSLRPCYYLPYRRQGMTRMKLSPPEGYDEAPVQFFATATIDGCSVYVEGPAGSPKVTHGNASRVSPPPALGRGERESDESKAVRIQKKIDHMDVRISRIKARQPGNVVVERPNYIEDYAPGQAAVMQQFAMIKGILLDQVVEYQPFGAVIGVCTDEGWKFFLQKNGRLEYFPNAAATRPSAAFMVLSANEFWPANTGGFRIF